MMLQLTRSIVNLKFIALLLGTPVVADLPLHCLPEDVLGEWMIFSDGGNFLKPQLCGHSAPNTVGAMLDVSKDSNRIAHVAPNEKLKVVLTNQVQDGKLIALAADGQQGSWTMVFDEGFEVRLAGKRYFAHFALELLPGHEYSKFSSEGDMLDKIGKYYGRADGHELQTAKGAKSVYGCHCDRTAVGWVARETAGKLHHGCFYANRVSSAKNASSTAAILSTKVSSAKNASSGTASLIQIRQRLSAQKPTSFLKPGGNEPTQETPLFNAVDSVTEKAKVTSNFRCIFKPTEGFRLARNA